MINMILILICMKVCKIQPIRNPKGGKFCSQSIRELLLVGTTGRDIKNINKKIRSAYREY